MLKTERRHERLVAHFGFISQGSQLANSHVDLFRTKYFLADPSNILTTTIQPHRMVPRTQWLNTAGYEGGYDWDAT